MVVSLACGDFWQPRDTESLVRRTLAGLSVNGLEFEAAGGTVAFPSLTLSEVSVEVAASPVALFHVVATGRYGSAALGYYGSERLRLGRRGATLAPDPGPWLPRLAAVLQALAERDRLVASGEAPAWAALADVAYRDGAIGAAGLASVFAMAQPAWRAETGGTLSVRIDGDHAEVGLTAPGSGAGSSRRASLRRRGDFWRFTSGLL